MLVIQDFHLAHSSSMHVRLKGRTLSELSENDWCPCSHNCVITTLWNMIISPCRLCSNYWIGDDRREVLRRSLCPLLDLTTAISSSYPKCTQGVNWNNSLRWAVNVKDWRSCKQTAERSVNIPQISKGSAFIGRVFPMEVTTDCLQLQSLTSSNAS